MDIDRTQQWTSTHGEPHVKRFHVERLDQARGDGDSEGGLLHARAGKVRCNVSTDFPDDWKTKIPALIKFVRDHHRPNFMEYGEYPFVTADEIKKALKVKKASGEMLDQMQ